MTLDEHARARMETTITLICGLGEITNATIGADSLKHTKIGLDAIRAIYELSDADRAVLSRLIGHHRELHSNYLTVRQVATMFKVKPKVIKGLAKWGGLQGYERKGTWVFSPDAIERFTETHQRACGVLLVDIAEWQRPAR